jgi:hypothetical protein
MELVLDATLELPSLREREPCPLHSCPPKFSRYILAYQLVNQKLRGTRNKSPSGNALSDG